MTAIIFLMFALAVLVNIATIKRLIVARRQRQIAQHHAVQMIRCHTELGDLYSTPEAY